ncbi:hypothetical protein EYF80_044509 [Liparis tanakae]|uniref:Uncharacterized protein n=1 Tax=Liparis tanakae TaxID=230148 RepID=A0A4Z2FVP2_9TELE|nr:hypothetical protein EYF80_044509 [Liparis tanakae]
MTGSRVRWSQVESGGVRWTQVDSGGVAESTNGSPVRRLDSGSSGSFRRAVRGAKAKRRIPGRRRSPCSSRRCRSCRKPQEE